MIPAPSVPDGTRFGTCPGDVLRELRQNRKHSRWNDYRLSIFHLGRAGQPDLCRYRSCSCSIAHYNEISWRLVLEGAQG